MATPLLNDDGSASMATLLMSSHHAFRRDIACFARALHDTVVDLGVLREEWSRFREALHGHHTVEDTAVFPDMRTRHPELASAIDELDRHHRAIDPLLAALPEDLAGVREVVTSLQRLLAEHLDAEERAIIPHLRGANEFPAMPAEMLPVYAEGFAWSMAGLAPSVCERILAMLPRDLVAHIPAARVAFDERCRRTWGFAHVGESTTSVPA